MTGNRLMEAITTHVGDAPIESLPVAFGAVATDRYTGEEIWLRTGSYMAAVRASSGVPGLFAPTWHEGRWLIDGGVVNPVPVSMCRALGADLVIAVDLSRSLTTVAMRAAQRLNGPGTQDASGSGATPSDPAGRAVSEEGTAILRKWSGLVDGLVESFRSKRTEPGLLEAMGSAVNIMQDRITRSRMAGDPPDIVIAPRLAQIGLMEFDRAKEAIAEGRACVQAALEPIRARVSAAKQSA
jgi:NTE family protein